MSCNRRDDVSMLTAERKALLLDTLTRDGRIVAKHVAVQLAISEDTIRRDLRELAAEGRLIRVHGGAMPVSPATQDFTARQQVATDSKHRVAVKAASLVESGQTVFVDGGTTSLAMCRCLPDTLRAQVITHAPTVAVALNDHPGIEVLLIGGRMYPHSVVTVGAVALEQIDGMRADVFFLGVSGIDPKAGLTTGDAEEAAMKRAFLNRAGETYVLASAEKLGTTARFRVSGLADVTAAICDTDAATDPKQVRALAKAGLAILPV
jgi:DeoR/GlpR family transcriptional regulator of sugar metabolism